MTQTIKLIYLILQINNNKKNIKKELSNSLMHSIVFLYNFSYHLCVQ